MEEKQVPRVSKLQSAIAQIDTAIFLFFCSEDEISLHTLAMASHEVISKLAQAKGGKSVHDSVIDSVKEEYKKKAKNLFAEAYNHFKHADRNIDNEVRFDEDINEYVLVSSTMAVKTYFPYLVSENLIIFAIWILAHRKEYFSHSIEAAATLGGMEKNFDILFPSSLSKKQYFEKCKKLFNGESLK